MDDEREHAPPRRIGKARAIYMTIVACAATSPVDFPVYTTSSAATRESVAMIKSVADQCMPRTKYHVTRRDDAFIIEFPVSRGSITVEPMCPSPPLKEAEELISLELLRDILMPITHLGGPVPCPDNPPAHMD